MAKIVRQRETEENFCDPVPRRATRLRRKRKEYSINILKSISTSHFDV